MIEQIVPGKTYKSRSGQLFRVTAIARHAQDCSIPMVVYQNIDPTVDAPAMTAWVVDESIFLRRFSEVGQ